jgi:ABC-type nickel/cobalt efflux system permease component RcnA
MKKHFFKIMALLLFTSMAISSCSVEYRERRQHDREQHDHDHDNAHHDYYHSY